MNKEKNLEKILVTSALIYANGPLHIGHVAGAYLPADIFVRFHRLLGSDIIFVSGTDEHGAPVSIKAEKEGMTPRQLVEFYHNQI
jgi:methionyl-tRNA synthetase